MTKVPLFFAAVCLAGFGALAANSTPEADPPPKPQADRVLNFGLLDYRGKFYELKRADAQVVVLFFTGNGCPIARQSVSKIRALRSKFSNDGAVFWMLNSNPQDDRRSIEEEAEEFKVGSVPILMDDNQGVARSLGVTRTCEAIAIDTKNYTILYRGAVDDQLTEGAKKPAPTQKYLETALTEFFAGRSITTAKAAVSGCRIKFEADEIEGQVSYTKQIAPLFAQKCVGCHSKGNIGPFAMNSHRKVKGWSDMIQEVVLSRRMPPWHADPHYGKFANDRSLTKSEAQLLLRWIEQGCPKDEDEDPLVSIVPPPSDWPLGKPDYVVALPKQQNIPATGVLQYRYVTANFEMPHDAWVRAAVTRPDNRKVVHHIIIRVLANGQVERSGDDVFLTSWAPGNALPEFPSGTGKFLSKGARFNFELHYNTTGSEQTDNSELGLYLLKEPPKMTVETRAPENREFSISPGEVDSRSHALGCFKRDTIIFDLIPHMHLRGSWMKYEALYPTGKRETLLVVPNYDFNWQTEYRLATPKRVPAGTWMFVTGGFDNSAKNPHNPDPTKRVKWGLQSHEEMFMGFMNVAEVPEGEKEGPRQARVGLHAD